MDGREDRIRQRAYELWEQRGRGDGQEHEHWLEAERELATYGDGEDPAAVELAGSGGAGADAGSEASQGGTPKMAAGGTKGRAGRSEAGTGRRS